MPRYLVECDCIDPALHIYQARGRGYIDAVLDGPLLLEGDEAPHVDGMAACIRLRRPPQGALRAIIDISEPGDYVAARPINDLTHMLARCGGYRC